MKTPQQKIADYIEIDGREVAEIINDDLEWWGDEVWRLKSKWSPEGVSAFITFLVDPMFEGTRSKGEAVWGVGVSSEFPLTLEAAQSCGVMSLKSGIKTDMEEFMDKVEIIRSCAINNIGL